MSGCGEGWAYFGCTVTQITSAESFDFDTLQHDVNMVVNGMVRFGIASFDEACTLVQKTPVHINGRYYSWIDEGVEVSGIFVYEGEEARIEVPRSLNALAHEFLHALDYSRNSPVFQTEDHDWWGPPEHRYLDWYENDVVCSLNVWDNWNKPDCITR